MNTVKDNRKRFAEQIKRDPLRDSVERKVKKLRAKRAARPKRTSHFPGFGPAPKR